MKKLRPRRLSKLPNIIRSSNLSNSSVCETSGEEEKHDLGVVKPQVPSSSRQPQLSDIDQVNDLNFLACKMNIMIPALFPSRAVLVKIKMR